MALAAIRPAAKLAVSSATPPCAETEPMLTSTPSRTAPPATGQNETKKEMEIEHERHIRTCRLSASPRSDART